MNIQNMPQYTKTVRGIYQPSTRFKNQDFKLVFVYPMLFADKLPNYSTLEPLLRDFLAVTFLKELFVENAINVVSLASQIRPIVDEEGRQVDPMSVVMQALASNRGYEVHYGGSSSPPNYPVSSVYRYELQQKIKEKTAVIYKYTQTDPVLSRLRPYIEIITMGNLIDIPVVVGTKTFQVDTLSLLHFLITAISLNLPDGLSKESNITTIYNTLKSLNPKRYWTLLNNLRQCDISFWSRFRQFILNNIPNLLRAGRAIKSGAASIFPTAATHLNRIRALARQYSSQHPTEIPEIEQLSAILNTVQSNLDQTALFFRMCLNPTLLKSQTGVNIVTSEQSVRSDVRTGEIVSREARAAQARAISDFHRLMDVYCERLLTSSGFSIHPVPTPPNFEIVDLINECIKNIMDGAAEVDVFSPVMTSFESSSYEEIKLNLERAKKFCQFRVNLKPFDDIPSLPIAFNYQQLIDFLDKLENAVKSAQAQINTLELSISTFADNDSVRSTLNQIRTNVIEVNINRYFNSFLNQYNNNTLPAMTVVTQNSPNPITLNTVRNSYIRAFVRFVSTCFYFYYLCALRDALCSSRFISTIDVQFERSVTEVTDPVNYSLVLPLEIVLALHAAVTSRGWNELIRTTENNIVRVKTPEEMATTNVSTPSDNYIRGLIRFISLRLNVPNLFVVDSKKQIVYYKLMHQTSINQARINTIDTFIQSALNRTTTLNV